MTMEEHAARQVVLAQAIETGDTQGRLLGKAERDDINRRIREQTKNSTALAGPLALQPVLHERAKLVLHTVEKRNPVLAALQQARPWQRWLVAGAPLAAFVMGVLTDRVANPHRVDLLSLPLLLIVLWNLAIYVVLVASYFRARPGQSPAPFTAVRRTVAGWREWQRRSEYLSADVTTRFFLQWHAITASLNAQRWRRVLHWAAAMWGAGVAASLFARGLVVEYRVGWESTFLSAEQVHAILSVLFMPVAALFSVPPFTVQEVAVLRFDGGTGAVAGARWVYLYATLLLLVVMLPRLVLGALAFRREKLLSRAVSINLGDPYYQRLIDMLSPTRVQLAVHAPQPEDRAALLRILLQEAPSPDQTVDTADAAACHTAIRTPGGDELRVVKLPSDTALPRLPERSGNAARWPLRLYQTIWPGRKPTAPDTARGPEWQAIRQDSDAVLQTVASPDDLQAALPLLEWLGKPALVLLNLPASEKAPNLLLEQCRVKARDCALVVDVLPFDSFARSWVQERRLLDAVGRCLAEAKMQGFARLTEAWSERAQARFREAMSILATYLLQAAAQVEIVRSSRFSLKSLVSASEREASVQAEQAAMVSVIARLQRAEAAAFSSLLRLHRLEGTTALPVAPRLVEKFVLQKGINSPQAGMAGAASGAAMGASVDLMTGGLTLGAAAALGALVGGSAAFVAAAWKNKATASGDTVVQLSNDMLQALVEASLLRYLTVASFGLGGAGLSVTELSPLWKSEVLAVVKAGNNALKPLWAEARSPKNALNPTLPLARQLEGMAKEVLKKLYPDAQVL